MCKDCENKELEMNEEQLNDSQQGVSLEDMSKEELLDVVYQLLDSKAKQIELDNTDIAKSNDFNKGIEKASYYAGFYSCLLNSGFSVDNAYELTLNQNTCDNNQELQKIVNGSSEKIARIQELKIEQNQI